MPSIDVATQLSTALEIPLDYLVGVTNTLLKTNTVKRILDMQDLKDEDKKRVFALLDAFLKQTKVTAII